MSFNYCKHCGTRLENHETNTCENCGENKSTNPNNESKKNEKLSSISNWIQQTKTKLIQDNKPRFEKARTSVTEGLGKVIESIKDPNNLNFGGKELSPKYREKLAKSLAAIKEKIQPTSLSGEESESLTEEEIQAQEIISDELLNQLKNDRCIVCYGDFKDQENLSVLICPQCGQGGHSNHLESYIDSNNGQCPVCRQKSDVSKWFELEL